jgi:aspartate aminotransferase-like enzyme
MLYVPGPVNTSEGMSDISYFRDSDFSDLILENETLLKEAIGCKDGRVVPLTCSGTGAMDAVATNLISKQDKVLVVEGGTFGRRWHEINEFYGKDVVRYPVEFGRNINFEKFSGVLNEKEPSVILIQHHETSSGQLYDIKKIGEITKEKGILFIVDAICSFLTDPYNMDEYGVNVTVLSSQKGLRLDGGMSFIILNDNAIEHLKDVEKLSYYNNLDSYLDNYNLGRGNTPFTPPVRMIFELNQRLRNLEVKKK